MLLAKVDEPGKLVRLVLASRLSRTTWPFSPAMLCIFAANGRLQASP